MAAGSRTISVSGTWWMLRTVVVLTTMGAATAGCAQGTSSALGSSGPSGPVPPAAMPVHVITLRASTLADARARLAAGDPELRKAYDHLLHNARKALTAPLVAVTDKHTLLPPSNDKHDYYSLSPYWWPDPSKPNGLPYIRRDGVTNPESKRDLDQPRVAAMGANVETLALAYYFTGDETYAARATAQLRRWFLDPATRMNPHLRYAQAVRGLDAERGSGIIDTRWFIETVNAIGLLQSSRSWTPADQRGMQAWFTQYLTWLRTSPNGQHEHAARNNHGSWYAAQTGALAMFTGDTVLARQIAQEAKARIGWQILPDGSQPIELERTRSYHYSGFNATALSRLAEIGRTVGVDLWQYQAPSGGSLRRAIDHIAKYAANPRAWPGQQIDTEPPDDLLLLLRRAQTAFGDTSYIPVLRALPRDEVESDYSELLYPDPPNTFR